jgi:hypothetical protein
MPSGGQNAINIRALATPFSVLHALQGLSQIKQNTIF